MSKKSKNPTNGETMSEESTTPEMDRPQPKHVAPAGYEEQSMDVVGFWNPEGEDPLHFIPMYARLFDSQVEPQKISALIVGAVVDPILVVTSREEHVRAEKGELIGVWAKPGMSAIRELGGEPVFMYQDGELDVGKPNPMKTFKVMSKKRGTPLPVTGDFRKKSKRASSFLIPDSQIND